MSGFVISEVWAFVAVDPRDGDEGVIGFSTPSGWMVAVCADKKRLRSVYPMVRMMIAETGATVRLVRMTSRQEVATLTRDNLLTFDERIFDD